MCFLVGFFFCVEWVFFGFRGFFVVEVCLFCCIFFSCQALELHQLHRRSATALPQGAVAGSVVLSESVDGIAVSHV